MCDSCPCDCAVGALCDGVGCLAEMGSKMASTAAGRASMVAAMPLVLLGAALAAGATDMASVSEGVSCMYNCSCLCSYLYGGIALYALGIQKAYQSVGTPKLDDVKAEPPVMKLDANGKVAAKAA